MQFVYINKRIHAICVHQHTNTINAHAEQLLNTNSDIDIDSEIIAKQIQRPNAISDVNVVH